MRAQSRQFFHCSDFTREWKQQVENLGFRKLRQLPNRNQNLIGFRCIFTMRESTEVETQQLADCVISPSNTSSVLLIKPKRALAWKDPLAHPEPAKHSKLQPPLCSPAGFPTLCPVVFSALLHGPKARDGEGKDVPPVHGVLLTEQSCKSRICWGANPGHVWESHLEVAAHKLCCTRDFS